MEKVIYAALILLNAVSFFLMGYDKHNAKRKKRRVPERTLFLSAVLFGALGGTLGMLVFRHKTKHWYFAVGFPALLAVEAALGFWLAHLGGYV